MVSVLINTHAKNVSLRRAERYLTLKLAFPALQMGSQETNDLAYYLKV
jgi:hypothetical protein